jgi:hypothetical protein
MEPNFIPPVGRSTYRDNGMDAFNDSLDDLKLPDYMSFMPWAEAHAIEQAAKAISRRDFVAAERWRRVAGYDKLTPTEADLPWGWALTD